MSPWTTLISKAPELAEKMRSMRPPKIRVVVDGKNVYWGLVAPTDESLAAHARFFKRRPQSMEDWLVERLSEMSRKWPDANEVELLGVWAGNPPRLELIAWAGEEYEVL